MINKNWIRWIRASCRKHFDSYKGSNVLHIEGLDRDGLSGQQEFAEFRLDGPHVQFLSGLHRLEIDIAIGIQVKQDPDDLDKIARFSGLFHEAFTASINVFKFGDTADDDPDELLGCLMLSDRVRYNYFGVVDTAVKLEQAQILARYYIEL